MEFKYNEPYERAIKAGGNLEAQAAIIAEASKTAQNTIDRMGSDVKIVWGTGLALIAETVALLTIYRLGNSDLINDNLKTILPILGIEGIVFLTSLFMAIKHDRKITHLTQIVCKTRENAYRSNSDLNLAINQFEATKMFPKQDQSSGDLN